jgi:hypothetical protein
MNEILAIVGLVAGFATGWLVRTISALSAISRAQERMQRKVRYWQSEAVQARSIIDHLRRLLAASGISADEPAGPDPRHLR